MMAPGSRVPAFRLCGACHPGADDLPRVVPEASQKHSGRHHSVASWRRAGAGGKCSSMLSLTGW